MDLRLRAAVIPPLAQAEGSPDRISMERRDSSKLIRAPLTLTVHSTIEKKAE